DRRAGARVTDGGFDLGGDGRARCDRAGRNVQIVDEETRLVRLLPAHGAVADANAGELYSPRDGRGRVAALRRGLGRAARAEARDDVVPVRVAVRVAREIQHEAVELDRADLDTALEERHELHAHGRALDAREGLGPESGRVADAHTARRDGE